MQMSHPNKFSWALGFLIWDLKGFTREVALHGAFSKVVQKTSGKVNWNLEFLVFNPSFINFPLEILHCI